MADLNITIEAKRKLDQKRKTASRAENVRRALARWKAGKGGLNTQLRLQRAGYNFANVNPGHPPPPRTLPIRYDNPWRPADPRVVAAEMMPVFEAARRRRR